MDLESAVGAVSAWMARFGKAPVAVIAFAGAVTMMPGLHIYRALGGSVALVRQGDQMGTAALLGIFSNALQACIVVIGLALGLLLGARSVLSPSGKR